MTRVFLRDSFHLPILSCCQHGTDRAGIKGKLISQSLSTMWCLCWKWGGVRVLRCLEGFWGAWAITDAFFISTESISQHWTWRGWASPVVRQLGHLRWLTQQTGTQAMDCLLLFLPVRSFPATMCGTAAGQLSLPSWAQSSDTGKSCTGYMVWCLPSSPLVTHDWAQK